MLAQRSSWTSGNSSATMSGVPSVLPLSTTVTRIVADRGGCARRLYRQRRSSASAPWLTITTSRSGGGSAGMSRRLVGAFAAHDRPRRPQQKLQVGDQREVVEVVALDRQALLERQVAAAIDLHRPGQPRL